jgi:hypothetical protein
MINYVRGGIALELISTKTFLFLQSAIVSQKLSQQPTPKSKRRVYVEAKAKKANRTRPERCTFGSRIIGDISYQPATIFRRSTGSWQ